MPAPTTSFIDDPALAPPMLAQPNASDDSSSTRSLPTLGTSAASPSFGTSAQNMQMDMNFSPLVIPPSSSSPTLNSSGQNSPSGIGQHTNSMNPSEDVAGCADERPSIA